MQFNYNNNKKYKLFYASVFSSSSTSLKLVNLIRTCFVLFSMFFLFSINIYLKSPKKFLNKSLIKQQQITTVATTSTSTKSILNYNDCNFLKYRFNETDSMCDLMITIKSTKRNHEKKLKAIIDTWFNLIPLKVYIVTDDYDENITKLTNNRLVVTNCENSHARDSLICKLAVEFQIYYKNPTKWYCHADDDTYFNIEKLYQILSQYDPMQPWYIGRISISQKINIIYDKKPVEFSFATGGAGYCISLGLALKLAPYFEPNNLIQLSNKVGLPDDVLLGFIIEIILKIKLTENKLFHSHLEYLGYFNEYNLKDQVSLSYSFFHKNLVNITTINNNEENDPTKFKSIHCFIYPNEELCNSTRNH